MSRSRVRKNIVLWMSLCFFGWTFFCVPSVSMAQEGRKLWKGNALLGVVPVLTERSTDFVSLERLAQLAECTVTRKGDSLFLAREGKVLEFVSDAVVARLNGQIQPLRHSPLVRDEVWWGEAREVLVLLNRLLGLPPEGVTGFRWAGTGTVDEGEAPASSPGVFSQPAGTPSQVLEEWRKELGMGRSPSSESSVEASSGEGVVERIRWWQEEENVRVVFDLASDIVPVVARRGDAVEVRFPGLAAEDVEGGRSPYVESIALTLSRSDGALLCVFSRPAGAGAFAEVKSFSLSNPSRFVLDFRTDGSRASAQPSPVAATISSTTPEPVSRTEPLPVSEFSPPDSPGRPTKSRPLVVVDAGHGGKDPGAMANSLREKDINLKVAIKLGRKLRERGYDVRFVRETDVYLKLQERTNIANNADADLFVSLHVNALPPGRHAKGVEIYIMALPTDEDAMKLALFENRELGGEGMQSKESVDKKTQMLLHILGDMQQNAKISESMSFAEVLFQHGKKGGLPMRRVAQAPFFVLRGAGMPAVLVEMGFLTERSEAKQLATDAYQEKIADSLLSGIVAYLPSR